MPLPSSLTAETPYPDIPDKMTWGQSPERSPHNFPKA
ncbi:hypothetical protein [Klebsiella pneumoniae]